MLSMKTECERDDSLFMAVEDVARASVARRSSDSASMALATATCRTPVTTV
jgi:hypothetical protein